MTLEEIIKKITEFITEFLKRIYRSEKFSERLISFVLAYILTSLFVMLLSGQDASIFTLFLEGLITMITFDFYYAETEILNFTFIPISFLIFYLVSRTLYLFIIKRFGS